MLPIAEPQKVEDLALRLTLRYLGDTAPVKTFVDDSSFNQDGWKVGVYRTDHDAENIGNHKNFRKFVYSSRHAKSLLSYMSSIASLMARVLSVCPFRRILLQMAVLLS